MDEHLTRHMEQGDGESHTLPHEEHHQQENNLKRFTSSVDVFSLMIIMIFFLSNTSRNMLQCYMYIFHSSESLHFLNCKYIAKHPRMCTYRENSSTNGIEKQSLNIIRCHFFSKH